MRYEAIDPELFVANRAGLALAMKPQSLAVFHSNDLMPSNADGTLAWRQNNDLFYLSGIDQEESVLICYPDAVAESDREILFVRETSELLAIWEGEKLTKEGARKVSGLQNVQWLDALENFLHRLIPQVENLYLSTNEHLRASSVVETRNRRFITECQARYPLHRYERSAPILHKLRATKKREEIRLIEKAVKITEQGFRRVLGFVKPGVGEWEIEAEFLHEFVRSRSRGFAYTPIVGSGKNACVLHYIENKEVCQDGDLILMDVGAEYGNWNADMTRTIPVNGKFTERQRAVYDSVLRVLRRSNEILRPGILMKDYQGQVLEFMEEELIGLGLIDQKAAGEQDANKPLVREYFMHGCSHHLGLDVHDVSPPNMPVAVGMVFTIEPGIYIREEGLGIRLENNVVIGEEENIDLFEEIPIEADEIEALMSR